MSERLVKDVTDCVIRKEVLGSDHCPLVLGLAASDAGEDTTTIGSPSKEVPSSKEEDTTKTDSTKETARGDIIKAETSREIDSTGTT